MDRYFVVSRQDWIVEGTKDTGYASYKAARNARSRVDSRDTKNGKGFTAMKVILGTSS